MIKLQMVILRSTRVLHDLVLEALAAVLGLPHGGQQPRDRPRSASWGPGCRDVCHPTGVRHGLEDCAL